MSKPIVVLKVNPVQTHINEVFVKCDILGVEKTYMHNAIDEELVVSILRTLGIQGKVFSNFSLMNKSVDIKKNLVLMVYDWIKEEDCPVVKVIKDGIFVGVFSLDPIGLPSEILSTGVLEILGYDVLIV